MEGDVLGGTEGCGRGREGRVGGELAPPAGRVPPVPDYLAMIHREGVGHGHR